MAIKNIAEMPKGPVVIDITGPEGNAFVLMGKARSFAKQTGMSQNEISDMLADMKSGGYEHLLDVFEKHFGSFVEIYR